MFERIRNAVGGKELQTESRSRTSTGAESTEGGSRHRSDTTEPDRSDASADNEQSKAEPTEIGEIFEILRNQRRRRVLRYLAIRDEHVPLGTLATEIAALECDKDPEHVNSQERKRVYVSLYQGHLPKMDAVNAIAYDKNRGIIERGQEFEEFRSYLPTDQEAGSGEDDQTLTQYVRNLAE